jgi:hypothetical protein
LTAFRDREIQRQTAASFRPLMITCCPFRHIPYNTWRIQTLQWLFEASGTRTAAPLFLAQSLRAGGHGRRNISSSPRTLARDNIANNQSQGSGKAKTEDKEALGCLQSYHRQRDGPEGTTFDGEHARQLQSRQLPRVEGDHGAQSYRHASLDHKGCDHTVPQDKWVAPGEGLGHEQKPWKRGQKRRGWSPYDEHGKDDLKALASSLQKSVESLESARPVGSEAASHLKPSESLPVSPLVQALERKKATKPPVRGAETEELADNPWAAMLASPMRLCSATGVRLPKDLLVPWGLVGNPATQEVYFMPTELANLESLKDKRRSLRPSASALSNTATNAKECTPSSEPDSPALHLAAHVKSGRKRSEVDFSTVQNGNDIGANARLDEGSTKPQASGSPSNIYMLPFLPLLHHLTLRFTTSPSDMATRRSRPNALHSILPYRLKVSIDRAGFYAEQRAKPWPSSSPRETANNLLVSSVKNIKWDGNIDDVVLRILRERLLAALEMLGNRNQKLWRQERERVKAFHVTRTSDAMKETRWKLLGRDGRTQPVAENVDGSTANGPSICLLIERNHANSPSLPQAIFRKPDHFGNGKTPPASKSASAQSADGSRGNYRDLEPSVLRFDQSGNVPLFSLNDLFDTDHRSRFFQLTTTIGVLAPRQLAPGDGNRTAYVLVIPTTAFGAKSVVEEAWRLWRFLGGRGMYKP